MNYLNYIPKFEIPSNKLTYYFPIEHPRAEEARLKRLTVELLLALEKAQAEALKNLGVIIEDHKDAYLNQLAAIKNNPQELQRQKEGEAKAKENAAKAFNGSLAMGMPSTYYNLFNLDNLLSNGLALALDLGSMALLGGAGLAKLAIGRRVAQNAFENRVAREIAEKSAAKTAAKNTRHIIETPSEESIRLYRILGKKNTPSSIDGSEQYVGQWFTDNPSKPISYGVFSYKTLLRNGIKRPEVEIEYIDVPKSKLENYRASNIIKDKNIEFEPDEDFLIPLNVERHGNDIQLTGNFLKDSLIPADRRVVLKPTIRTSLSFFERPSKLTEAERLGIPKHERKELGDFKSELDWTPREWMKANLPNEFGNPYSAYDAMSLLSHVPEYLKIEKLLKTSGNYDPSKFYDPRSYILLQSKVANNLSSPIYSGVKTPEISATYNGPFWGTYGLDKISGYQARAYGISDDHTLQLAVPKDAKTFTFDANKKHWHSLEGEGLTNGLVERKFTEGFDRVDINNVIDAGKNSGNIGRKSKFLLFPNLIDELIMPMVPQNDVIINKYVPRKSIIGNNGNFNLEDLNIYRKSGGKLNYLNYINNVGRTI